MWVALVFVVALNGVPTLVYLDHPATATHWASFKNEARCKRAVVDLLARVNLPQLRQRAAHVDVLCLKVDPSEFERGTGYPSRDWDDRSST